MSQVDRASTFRRYGNSIELSAPAPLYLDHAASTPTAPEVIDAMLPWLREAHANPHSSHSHGLRAAAAVESARDEVAALIGAPADEIIFTSGATESNNIALLGLLSQAGLERSLAVSLIEHKSVLEVAEALRARGVEVVRLPVDATGRLQISDIEDHSRTTGRAQRLLSFAHANNEIGTVQALADVVATAHGRGWQVHVDAAQSAGKLPLDVVADDVDLLSLSSHKIYGPGGIGALFIHSALRAQLRPIMFGGGQEAGLRPGTIPTFLAVGFGAAARLAKARMRLDFSMMQSVAQAFLLGLKRGGVAYELLGDPLARLPGLLSIRLPGIDADDLLGRIAQEVSASTGSACSAGELRASHVLRGLGMDERSASEVIRLSFGRSSSVEQGSSAAAIVQAGVEQLQSH